MQLDKEKFNYADVLPVGGAYMIVNKNNGIVYVGQSKNMRKRIMYHKSRLKGGYHPCKKMQDDYNNGSTFYCKMLQISTEANLLDLEDYYIAVTLASGKEMYNSESLDEVARRYFYHCYRYALRHEIPQSDPSCYIQDLKWSKAGKYRIKSSPDCACVSNPKYRKYFLNN